MGAWIEIHLNEEVADVLIVAPHDGCVDWNSTTIAITRNINSSHPTMGAWIEMKSMFNMTDTAMSHPTMGAWIEISFSILLYPVSIVAPHDGCVDWNFSFMIDSFHVFGRTPRWVRGLKYWMMLMIHTATLSHPTMGAWIEIWFTSAFNGAVKVAPHDGCVDWNYDNINCF